MTPRDVGCADVSELKTPTDAGTSQVFRVRSGLICLHLCPPSRVVHSVFAAKYRRCGSSGEKTTGSVRITRKFGEPSGTGRMFCAWVVRRSYRVSLPPNTMSESTGSVTTYPYSSAATGCQSRKVISPSLPRLEMQTEPLS